MDRGAWWTTGHGFIQSDTTERLSLFLSSWYVELYHLTGADCVTNNPTISTETNSEHLTMPPAPVGLWQLCSGAWDGEGVHPDARLSRVRSSGADGRRAGKTPAYKSAFEASPYRVVSNIPLAKASDVAKPRLPGQGSASPRCNSMTKCGSLLSWSQKTGQIVCYHMSLRCSVYLYKGQALVQSSERVIWARCRCPMRTRHLLSFWVCVLVLPAP